MSAPSALTERTWIDNFRVVRKLGRGGFGVTYLAEEFREWEAGSATGEALRLVAIKEYFPIEFATRDGDGQSVIPYPGQPGELFQHGKEKFLRKNISFQLVLPM